jgi:hypothetical protein
MPRFLHVSDFSKEAMYFARADILPLRPTTLSVFKAGVCLESD